MEGVSAWMQKREPKFQGNKEPARDYRSGWRRTHLVPRPLRLVPLADQIVLKPTAQLAKRFESSQPDHHLGECCLHGHATTRDCARRCCGSASFISPHVDDPARALRHDEHRYASRPRVFDDWNEGPGQMRQVSGPVGLEDQPFDAGAQRAPKECRIGVPGRCAPRGTRRDSMRGSNGASAMAGARTCRAMSTSTPSRPRAPRSLVNRMRRGPRHHA